MRARLFQSLQRFEILKEIRPPYGRQNFASPVESPYVGRPWLSTLVRSFAIPRAFYKFILDTLHYLVDIDKQILGRASNNSFSLQGVSYLRRDERHCCVAQNLPHAVRQSEGLRDVRCVAIHKGKTLKNLVNPDQLALIEFHFVIELSDLLRNLLLSLNNFSFAPLDFCPSFVVIHHTLEVIRNV